MTHTWTQVARWAGVVVGLVLLACTQPPTKVKHCGKDADCATGETCTNGTCVASKVTCTANSTVCDGSKVMKCSADGTTLTLVTVCGTSCTDGACTSQMCTPGDQRCDGNNLVRCSMDGTMFEPVSVCSLGCDATTNTCKSGVCRPGSTRCNAGGQLETCDTSGAMWNATACDADGPGQCTSNGLSGAAQVAWCEKLACHPGDIRCDGLQVVQCDQNGAGESLVTSCEHACSNGACVEGSCNPGDQRCSMDGKSLERCNDLGTGWDMSTCTTDGTGVCISVPGISGPQAARCARTFCTPSATRCDMDKRFQCSQDGLSETVVETCTYGCAADGTCSTPACTPGDQRCDGDTLEQCQPDQRGYVFQQFCMAGCVAGQTGGQHAHCANQVCSPLDARCGADGVSLQRCRADGSGYDSTPCDPNEVCTNGACVAQAPSCVQDAVRCNGHDIEKCESVNNQPLSYTKLGSCLGNCSGGACDNQGECAPFNLAIQLVAPGANLPGDGQSTFLILSDPLVGPDGLAVPDGTLVTVAASGNGGPAPALLTGDADPSTPGLQVPVVDGRIDFMIGAPSLPLGTQTATIKAQIGDRAACGATLGVTFDASISDRYAAEDFSTTRMRDTAFSSGANWDVKRGVVTINAFDAGDGRDGDLVVAAGQTIDLSTRTSNGHTFGDMASAPVQEINGDHITISGSVQAFQETGTRVLIINLRGAPNQSASVGSYEFGTVSGIDGGALVLAQPVTRRFGVGGNNAAALMGQVVRVIRVPQYNSVQVAGTLTGPAFDGTQGGVIAFFAASPLAGKTSGGQVVPKSNIIYGTGQITMKGKGFRGASQPSTNSSGLSGEGIEASWNTPSPVGGNGVSGGGYCCGDGDIVPSSMPAKGPGVITPGSTPPPDVVTHKYFGSGGSFATQGASSCPAFGPGAVYGDSQLQNLYMGGGSGSISQSEAHSCYTTRTCCRRTDAAAYGQCCTTTDAAAMGCINTPYCDAISYIWNGVYSGQPGGGIILITAAAFTVTDNATIDASGVNSSVGTYGSAGGSIYVRGQKLSLGGVGHINALGGLGGGDGRVRIDTVTIDSGFTAAWTTPAANFVQQSPSLVQSLVELTLATMPTGYAQSAGVMFPVGMSIPMQNGSPDMPGSIAATNLSLWFSEDSGQNWGLVSSQGALSFGGSGQPPVGSSMKWRLTAPTTTGSTRGLAAKFTRN